MTDLEKQISHTITDSLGEVIKSKLGGYNSPLDALIVSVVASRTAELRGIVETAIDDVLHSNIRDRMKEALEHKLAKLLVSKLEGEVEKRLVDLRTNPEFRAKVTIAVYALVDQMVKDQKKPTAV